MTYLSVIIPVYNVAPYLRECLDAVIHQTMQDIEIIITDDGSTDGCGAICDEYAMKDSRIKVIHQENLGLSMARNNAMKLAKGQYWMFVDSDDIPDACFCEEAYRLIKIHDADIVAFQYRMIPKETRRNIPNESRMLSSEEALFGLIDGTMSVAVWNKIYRRELFDELMFPEGMLFEDIGTTYKLFERANRVFLSTEVLYTYRFRKGSISRTKSKHTDLHRHIMYQEMYLALFRFFCTDESLISRDEMAMFAMSCAIEFDPKEYPDVTAFYNRILRRKLPFRLMKTPKRKFLLAMYLYANPLFHFLCRFWGRRG